MRDETQKAGLCATCAHMRRIKSDRGSVFYLCEFAKTDQRFPKYPQLPVLHCDGFRTPTGPPAR